jgi:3-oxoacyl-[acyl-carrier-protein] synthase-3
MMETGLGAKLTAIGVYYPERVVRNKDFEEIVDTNEEWIESRTGIKFRRISAPDESCNDLAIKSVQHLVNKFNTSLLDVDFVLASSSTSNCIFPSLASQIQRHFSIPNCGSLDISAACAGFTYSLVLANSLIKSGQCKRILVVAAEAFSKVLDYTDRNTCILFGDGASSFLVEPTQPMEKGIIGTYFGTDGDFGVNLYLNHTANKLGNDQIRNDRKIHQDGRKIFKWAVKNIPDFVRRMMSTSNQKMEDIKWFVPHSANKRIIDAIAQDLGIPEKSTLQSVEYFGNTSCVSIPIALYEAMIDGKIRYGDRILLYGFGGGMVHAGVTLDWTIKH